MPEPDIWMHHTLGAQVYRLVQARVPPNSSATDVARLGQAVYRCLQAGLAAVTPGPQRHETIDATAFRAAVLAELHRQLHQVREEANG